jgi:Zn-dependent protease
MDANAIQQIILIIPGFLIAITVHEFAHGYVAYRLGDPTAKLAGRLTLNPLSHLDLVGTLALILTRMIGWAKPVPVDPRYLRDPRRDMLWISLAGPASNIITATALAIVLYILVLSFSGSPMGATTAAIVVPILGMIKAGVLINVGLGIFNLVPVPPLDGSKILAGMLPRDLAYKYEQLEPYGFIILLVLIFTGIVRYIVYPPIMYVQYILLGWLG